MSGYFEKKEEFWGGEFDVNFCVGDYSRIVLRVAGLFVTIVWSGI